MIRYLAIVATVCAVLAAACDGGDSKSTPTSGPTQPASATAAASATSQASPAATGTAGAGGLITIDAPVEGSTVGVPIPVSGTANVFEGVLQVALLDPAGATVCQRRVQATSGTGTQGTWETTVAFPPPAAAQAMTLRAFDYSAKDGSEENIVTRGVTVSSDLPRIVIETPRCNATFGPTAAIEVTGTALVFEAALTVELRDAFGRAFLQQHITATSGTERGTWAASFDLSQLPAGGGPYDIVAYDLSAADGSVENEFSVPISIAP